MWKKSLSEKIARVFEIVGYILLVPAALAVLVSAMVIFPLIISVPLFGIGLSLFVGYAKHSRGNLNESRILPLWIATFLFNFLPLLIPAYQHYSNTDERFESVGLFSGLLIFWWIIACCLSLTAIYDESKFGDRIF